MSIEVHATPNPNARKFVLTGQRFTPSRNFSAGQDGPVDDPLAAQLLALNGVYNVFMAQDFVTVNKVPTTEWEPLQAAVEAILADFLAQSTAGAAHE